MITPHCINFTTSTTLKMFDPDLLKYDNFLSNFEFRNLYLFIEFPLPKYQSSQSEVTYQIANHPF